MLAGWPAGRPAAGARPHSPGRGRASVLPLALWIYIYIYFYFYFYFALSYATLHWPRCAPCHTRKSGQTRPRVSHSCVALGTRGTPRRRPVCLPWLSSKGLRETRELARGGSTAGKQEQGQGQEQGQEQQQQQRRRGRTTHGGPWHKRRALRRPRLRSCAAFAFREIGRMESQREARGGRGTSMVATAAARGDPLADVPTANVGQAMLHVQQHPVWHCVA